MSDSKHDTIDEFLKQRLKLCRISSKGLIVGYLKSRQAFDELLRDLKVLGCSFSVRSCYVGKDDKGTFQYSVTSSDVQIPFTGSPFHVEGTTYYLCSQGSRYYKSKLSGEDENEEEEGVEASKKKRRKVSRTIKVGCPAKMTVKCIKVYPDYKAGVKSWRRKCDVLKRLKMDLKQTPPPANELHYWISVSPERVHNHERTATQKIQPLQPDLISEIHRLVKSGVTTVPEVKSHLLVFVKNMFKNSSIQPEPSNTAFYPCDKSIYNHLQNAKNSIKQQKSQVANAPEETLQDCSAAMETATDPDDPCSEEDTEESPNLTSNVPILSSGMESEWQDQPPLPSNLIQVVNNNGMIMLMVTQPLAEQISHVEGSFDSGTNVLNVNLDDNIFQVSVDDPTDRLLGLTNDEVMMSQACDSQDSLTHPLHINDSTNMLISDKTSDIDSNRIITVEGNLVVDVRHAKYEKDSDEESLACPGEQIPSLFSEDEQLQLVEQETQGMGPEISHQSSELRDNGSSSVVGPRTDIFHSSGPCLLSLRELKGIHRNNSIKDEIEQELLDSTPHSVKSKTLATIRETLQYCAQDIIKMSHCCSNIPLLEKLNSVLDKYRLRLQFEISNKQSSPI